MVKVSRSTISRSNLDIVLGSFFWVYCFRCLVKAERVRVYLNFTLWNLGVIQVHVIMFFGRLIAGLEAPSGTNKSFKTFSKD